MPDRKTVLITGATRGLGLAMAEKMAELGHIIVGCGRDPGRVEALRRKLGAPHNISAVNVTSASDVTAWAQRVLKPFGAPDLLLNNAALINRPAKLWSVSAQEFDAVIDANIKGVANVIRAFVPAMIKRGRGVIVNFSSGRGRNAAPDMAPYCATKWAIEGLTRSMAGELPAGLAAVALNPGAIQTDMLKISFGASAASYPTPKQWAQRAVPYLLSLGPGDNAKSVTAPGG